MTYTAPTQPEECATCGTVIDRGEPAILDGTDWHCPACDPEENR